MQNTTFYPEASMRKRVLAYCLIVLAFLAFANNCLAWDTLDKTWSEVWVKFDNKSNCPLYLRFKLVFFDSLLQESKKSEGRPGDGLFLDFRLLDVVEGGENMIILVAAEEKVIWNSEKSFNEKILPHKVAEAVSALRGYIRGFRTGFTRKDVKR